MRGSSLPLLTKCAGSTYLPREEYESENAIRAAEWGKLVHRWKETGEISGSTSRNHTALQRAIFESKIDRLALWPEGGIHETAVSLRVDGHRDVSRDDTPREGWITGHDDFQWWLVDGTLWIDDLKTGRVYSDPQTGINLYPQDVRSAQLRFYALAASRLNDYHGLVAVSLTHWPRLPLDFRHAPPVRYWTEYSNQDLLDYWSQLEELHKSAARGARGDYSLSPGAHCRFCPSRNYCMEAETF